MTLVLVRDLLSVAPIRGALAGKGTPAQFLRDPAALAAADLSEINLCLVDLNLPDVIPALAAFKAARPAIRIVGFVSHVDAETAKAARSAGVDKVLARSAFFKDPSSFLE